MEQATKLLEQLAVKLGTTVEYLWAVLVKQAYVNAITNLIFAGIAALVILIGLAFIPKIMKLDSTDGGYDISSRTLGWIIYLIITGACLITVIACTIPAITELANPEYWALKEVLSALGK